MNIQSSFSRPANIIIIIYMYIYGDAFTGACERDSVAWTVKKNGRVRVVSPHLPSWLFAKVVGSAR